MKDDRKICVGMIAGAHGVRGLVRLRSFTDDPSSISSYGPLTDESGKRRFLFELKSATKDFFIASIEGIENREAAASLRGIKLYVARSQMPKTGHSQFYEADLLGLLVKDSDGKDYGVIRSIHDYGAGVFFEIGSAKASSFMLPFRDAFVKKIDFKKSEVLIEVPEGWLEQKKPDPEEGDEVKAEKKVKKS